MEDRISAFLNASTFAVAGASIRQNKYGNKVFRALVESGRTTFPLNPTAGEVEGHTAFASLAELPETPDALSIVTPPEVTRKVVADAIQAGVKHVWMQPGAEDSEAIEAAAAAGMNLIADGSCILVLLARE